jgi:nitrite reductase/ring-hydroxylating ferredoxin subunit
VVAAIPGFIDYLYVVPPKSSGRRRATMHMAVNLGAVAAFALVIVLRGGPGGAAGPALLVVELLGLGLLTSGGWMGGTLVYRNQIGVDHRYAGAGKWKEARLSDQTGPVRVGGADELEVDQMKLLRIDGRRIVLARTEQGLVAFDDRCTHRGGSLAGGAMICGTVQCPWHGSQFDATTGAVKAGPAEEPIPTFAVEERDGETWIRL